MDVNNGFVSIVGRIAIELSYRINCIERQLSASRADEAKDYQDLAAMIGRALTETEHLLEAALILAQDKDTQAQAVAVDHLRKVSKWFATIHELLVYLPRPHVADETDLTIRSCFAGIYEEIRPSIILGGLFNALEFDFLDLMSHVLPDLKEIAIPGDESAAVLQLAICDRLSPAAWSALAHELGHTLDRRNGISEAVASDFVTDRDNAAYRIVLNWSKEICADLISAEVMGPSPILSLLSMEYCLFPLKEIFSSSETHPATPWRAELVSNYLAQKYSGYDLLQNERQTLEVSAEVAQREFFPVRRGAANRKSRLQRQKEDVFEPLAEAISEKVRDLHLPTHTINEPALTRCKQRLQLGRPVSAQGADRAVLREAIRKYESTEFTSKEDQQTSFWELTEAFVERPVDVANILASTNAVRQDYMAPLIATLGPNVRYSDISDIREKLFSLDELAANSIRVSWIHSRIKRESDEGVQ